MAKNRKDDPRDPSKKNEVDMDDDMIHDMDVDFDLDFDIEGFGAALKDMAFITKHALNETPKAVAEVTKNLTAKMPGLETWKKVPLKRRRETFGVFLFMCMLPLQLISWLISLSLLFKTVTAIPMVGYFIWIFFIDDAAVTGNRDPWMRDWTVWKWFCAYFPIELHKTTDLDPNDGTYLFGYHPHGIISLGAFGNFATTATGFKEKFPGINLKLATLSTNFRVPFQREITLGMGMVDASRTSCGNILGSENGNAMMLVVGGAQESLEAKLGTYELTLYRKGFVRQACIHGANLVPVISFGETDTFDLFDNPPGSSLRKVQEFLKRMTGIAPAFFKGRQMFDRAGQGFLPYRAPITSVVGAPIKCPKLGPDVYKNEKNAKIVDDIHARYVAQLKELWDKYKRQYAKKRRGSLHITSVAPPKAKKGNKKKKDE